MPVSLLLVLQHLGDDLVEIVVGLAQVRAFGRDVAVVEAVERDAELLHELEGHVARA